MGKAFLPGHGRQGWGVGSRCRASVCGERSSEPSSVLSLSVECGGWRCREVANWLGGYPAVSSMPRRIWLSASNLAIVSRWTRCM